MIPEQFFFKAYNSYSYKEFIEPNSFKPKNINELIEMVEKISFKENDTMDECLKKYFSFPYKVNPLEIISEEILKKYKLSKINKFEPILSDNDKIFTNLLGKNIGFFLSLLASQIRLAFDKNSKNSYFDFMFFLK